MVGYDAPSTRTFWGRRGTISQKLCGELADIDAAIKALGSGTGGLAHGKVWIGDSGGTCSAVTPSGDATIADTGAVTVANNAITSAKASPQYLKVAVVALTGGLENAFAFAWQNPESVAVLVHRVLVDVTHIAGTAGALLDIGTAANATTHSDNLIDGLDIQAATGLFDNITDKGSSGKTRQRMDEKNGSTDYITGQILVANASALTGNVYIYYTAVPAT